MVVVVVAVVVVVVVYSSLSTCLDGGKLTSKHVRSPIYHHHPCYCHCSHAVLGCVTVCAIAKLVAAASEVELLPLPHLHKEQLSGTDRGRKGGRID